MKYLWAVATHRGRVRSNNQDSVYPSSSGRGEAPLLMVVADGMGGHVAGEVASSIAVDAAADTDGTAADKVRAANHGILDRVTSEPALRGMGTTMTLVELGENGIAEFAHVGDSRAYLYRDGEIQQLTTDHTLMAEYLRTGKIKPEDVASHPQRSMLTRALGLTRDLEVDTFQFALVEGDRLLLCSDGVSSLIDEDEIASILQLESPEETAWAMVEAANRAGGLDNITALIVDVEETIEPSAEL